MQIAQILNNRVHWIFTAGKIPVWPPDSAGNPVVLVDITGRWVNAGDGYNPRTKKIISQPVLDNQSKEVIWDNTRYQFIIKPVDPEIVLQQLIEGVQAYLDTTVQQRGYDGILSLCSYSTSTDPRFGPEGRAGIIWRDTVWTQCYEIQAQVMSGDIPIPSLDELIAILPQMQWP